MTTPPRDGARLVPVPEGLAPCGLGLPDETDLARLGSPAQAAPAAGRAPGGLPTVDTPTVAPPAEASPSHRSQPIRRLH